MEPRTPRHATAPIEHEAAPEPAAEAQTVWTDAAVARLRELRANGRSGAQIARALGGVSRSAVNSKAHRLGLRRDDVAPASRSISAVRPCAPNESELERAEKMFAERARALARLEARLRREPVAPEAPAPESRPCSFMQLTRDTCRWPIGDVDVAGFHFCGAPPDGDHVYCTHHRSIAHAPEEAVASAGGSDLDASGDEAAPRETAVTA